MKYVVSRAGKWLHTADVLKKWCIFTDEAIPKLAGLNTRIYV
jgi:hypothetical protein